MKNTPAFKAALLAAGGIILGKEFPGYSILFLALAISSAVMSLSWFLMRKVRVPLVIVACVCTSLSLSFAFYVSSNLVPPFTLLNYSGFAGTVEQTPRDTIRSSLIIKDCLGYDGSWHRINGDLILSSSFKPDVLTGDRIVFYGKVVPLSSARNPGDFDLKSFYSLNGITGRLHLNRSENIIAVNPNARFNFFRDIIDPMRNFLRNRIYRFMSGDEAELARAMIIGERSGIIGGIKQDFVNTGTVHILSVSGLHVGFLSAMLLIIVSILRIPRKMRFFAIAPVLILYAFVVGMTPSITRAVLMALVILFGLFLQRKPQILNSLGFAALVILTFSPLQLFTPGFQLSFAAVASIAFFHRRILAIIHRSYPNMVERPFINSVVSLSVLTAAATLGTIPLTAYYFNRISLVSLISNLCIVPLTGIFTTLTFTLIGISVVSSCLAGIFGAAAQLIAFLILGVNSILGSVNISSVTVSNSGWIFALLYFGWLSAVIAFPTIKQSNAGDSFLKKTVFAGLLGGNVLLYASLFSNGSIFHKQPQAELFVLDVGQGDAIYVEMPGGTNMLIDAGMKFRSYDMGKDVVVPFLERRGVHELNYFVVTHLHADHMGGSASVIEKIKIDNFFYPDQASNSETWRSTLAHLRAFNIPSKTLSAGMILDSSSMCRVYVLHPNRKYVGDGGFAYKTRLNDGSIVLKICIGKESILLVGDAEKLVEQDLGRVYGSFLSSDILKIGHHGSNTSSSPEFLRYVHPAYAAISVGANNKFGHPSAAVIGEMNREGIKILRTDSSGAAWFHVFSNRSEIVQWK